MTHVHGETTITLACGRVLCNCGYERIEWEGGVAWAILGELPTDHGAREIRVMRSLLWLERMSG